MTPLDKTMLHARTYREHALANGRKALAPHVVNRIAKDVAVEHPDFDMRVWRRVVDGDAFDERG